MLRALSPSLRNREPQAVISLNEKLVRSYMAGSKERSFDVPRQLPDQPIVCAAPARQSSARRPECLTKIEMSGLYKVEMSSLRASKEGSSDGRPDCDEPAGAGRAESDERGVGR